MSSKTKKILTSVAVSFAALFAMGLVIGFAGCGDDEPCAHENLTLVESVTATCTEDGYDEYTCDDCGETVIVATDEATGHSWDDGAVTKEATAEDEGEMTYTCTECGETKTEVIAKIEPETDPDTGDDKGDDKGDAGGTGDTGDTGENPDDGDEEEDVVEDEDALIAALAEGEAVLGADITLSDTLDIETEAAIDLAGYTISYEGDVITVSEGAVLTITDTGETGSIECAYGTHTSVVNAAAIVVDGGDLVIEDGTVTSSSVGIRALSGSVVINGGTVTSTSYYALWEGEGTVDVAINGGIVGGSYAGVLVDGDSCFGYGNYNYQYGAVTTLTVTGGVVYSGGDGQAAIRTEGMTSTESAIITIEGGIVYGAAAAPGIFLGNGTLSISDGYIVGSTACEVQAGKVTVSGGTFIATETTQTVDTSSSNNASYTNGYALAIIPRGYIVRCKDENEGSSNFSMALDVTISGGTFVGDVYVANSATSASATGEWDLNATDSNYTVADTRAAED